MSITLIAAMAADRCIGKDGDLPFRLPSDLKRFRALTVGKPVIMGRKTWDSLPRKPLPGRLNIVLSRSLKELEGAVVVSTLEEAIEAAQSHAAGEELVVIGGSDIYRLTLPMADRLELTTVNQTVDGGDTFFPEYPEEEWELSKEEVSPDTTPDMQVLYRTYNRNQSV